MVRELGWRLMGLVCFHDAPLSPETYTADPVSA
jgi:hypothetical protein